MEERPPSIAEGEDRQERSDQVRAPARSAARAPSSVRPGGGRGPPGIPGLAVPGAAAAATYGLSARSARGAARAGGRGGRVPPGQPGTEAARAPPGSASWRRSPRPPHGRGGSRKASIPACSRPVGWLGRACVRTLLEDSFASGVRSVPVRQDPASRNRAGQDRRRARAVGHDLTGPECGGQEQRLAKAKERDAVLVAHLGRALQADQDREPFGTAHGGTGRGPALEPEPFQDEVWATDESLADTPQRTARDGSRPGRRGRRRSRSIPMPRLDEAAGACRRRPMRPQSWIRNVASDICWISASTTPAPIAWTVPAGIRMQSPARGSNRWSKGSTVAGLASPRPSACRVTPAAESGIDRAARLGVEDYPGFGLAVIVGQPPAAVIVGMDLDRKDLVGIEELHQERELVARCDTPGPSSSGAGRGPGRAATSRRAGRRRPG